MSTAVRTLPGALVSIVLTAVMLIVAAQLVTSDPGTSQTPVRAHHEAALAAARAQQEQRAAIKEAAAAMAAAIMKPITPTPPAPPPTTTTTTAPVPAPVSAPAAAPVQAPAAPVQASAAALVPAPAPVDPGSVPDVGQATASGCAAAQNYLEAYAAKGFAIECPGYAEGREAMTCVNQVGVCPGTSVIAIADACPQAYMNEASNSLVLLGLASAPIDPFGPCP